MTEIELSNSSRILVLGESGGGKTYLTRKFLKTFHRVLVITPQADEFKDYKNRLVTLDPDKVYETIAVALQEGNMMVVIDDSDILLEKISKDRRFEYFIKGGRHRGVGFTIISRRTTDVPTMIPKQANRLFLFQTDLPRDIEFLNEYFYPAGDQVKGLDRKSHEFLYVDRDAKTMTVMVA